MFGHICRSEDDESVFCELGRLNGDASETDPARSPVIAFPIPGTNTSAKGTMGTIRAM